MSEKPSVRILFRGDDAGLCATVNDVFVEALENQVLSAAGIMAPTPGAEDAAESLQKFNGKISLGLHACITCEWDLVRWGPVTGPHAVPTLADQNGHFYPTANVVEQHYRVQDVVQEITAQLDLLRGWGLELDYMDMHMGFQWLPGVNDALKELADANGLYYEESHNAPNQLLRVPRDIHDRLINDRDYSAFADLEPGDYRWVAHPAGSVEDMPALKADADENRKVLNIRHAEALFFTDPATHEALGTYNIERLDFRKLAAEKNS